MNELTLVVFLVLGLAAWRCASLLANESGPFQMFKRIRDLAAVIEGRSALAQSFHLVEMIECEWCNSMWIGAGIVLLWLRFGQTVVYAALVPALSTIVIIVKYIVQNLEAALNERALLAPKEEPKEKVIIRSLEEVMR